MNGHIHVESTQGQGSTFTVILPLEPVKESHPARAEANLLSTETSLEGRKVLLAEDNPINMEIAVELLNLQGVQVTQAWNGREALDQFASSAPGTFDLILMDMQMPEMDGCEAAEHIRRLPRPDAKTVPIIAVTANAFAEDIAATTQAGMDAHISKPIDFRILCQTMERVLKKREERR